jgi:three-Cys-motif partner protein
MCASSYEDEFFDRKRPWSHIKDRVIGCYMPPYLRKVAQLGKKIVLVDAFAGPGIYELEPSSSRCGSPIVIVNEAEKHTPDNYIAFFFNKKKAHHIKLSEVLGKIGIPKHKAISVHGDSKELLSLLQRRIGDETVLLYLDPFGLSVPFEVIKLFLERDQRYSTELIVNLSMPGIHRLAAKHAVREGRVDAKIQRNHSLLSEVLGGEWWREILFDTSVEPKQQNLAIIEQYTSQLRIHMPYAGYCPVREQRNGPIKYFITFCSRHIDALLLHNDNMCKAYNQYMREREFAGLLMFNEIECNWQDNRATDISAQLDSAILTQIKQHCSKAVNPARITVWQEIVTQPQHFMLYTSSEFKKRVDYLRKEKVIDFVDTRGTGRLNDDSRLFLLKDVQYSTNN